MSDDGLVAATDLMESAGVGRDAVKVFAHYYRQLESGATGLISEADIDPVPDLPHINDIVVDDMTARRALAQTVVIKLNGGLGTSMGMERAKSLLEVKGGLSFLDIIVRRVLAQRAKYGITLPLILMNSFRTQDDTRAALEPYPELATSGLPGDLVQNREPKLRADDLTPVQWPAEPDLEWCPPGHGDLYPALRSAGLLDLLIDAGFRYAFCSNADNLGAVVDARIAGFMADNDIPFLLESCRRTPADRKGGHLAIRKSDGRLVLRETAQTSPNDMAALQDLERHRYANTNNLWVDLQRLREVLDDNDGVLALPLIRNEKTVDPGDPSSPKVIQIESAMGAAVEMFEGARSLWVERDRFVPVKTTNDLLVLRSDVYELDEGTAISMAERRGDAGAPFVDLDPAFYKLLPDFEARFPAGPPSLVAADRFVVRGDLHFGSDVVIQGSVELDAAVDGEQVASVVLGEAG